MQVTRSIISLIKRLSSQIEFWQDYRNFTKIQSDGDRFQVHWQDRHPILNEKTFKTNFDSHYIYHPAWAARILARTMPSNHIDISSSLHFCTIVSAFLPVEFYDYRPVVLTLSGLVSKSADLICLPFANESIESLSCMHVVEHVGLGRYGDPLDPNGDLKAIAELKRVLAKDGTLLFVVPVGKPVVHFNAHRTYSYDQVASYFSDFHLQQFALITDRKEFLVDASGTKANQQKYGCGCWWFIK